MLSQHKKHLAVLAIILANIIWGAAAPIFKWSLQDMPPFTFAFLRFTLAALLLLPFTLHKLALRKGDILFIMLLAFFGFTINISFFLVAMTLTKSINAPIIGSAGPVFLVIGSMLYLKERPKRRVVTGTLLSLTGILVITLQPILQQGVDGSMFGNILLVVATIASVIYTLLLRKVADKYSPVTLTFWTFAIGAVTFLPGVLYESRGLMQLSTIHLQGMLGIIYGAVFSSVIAYLAFTYALRLINVNEIGTFLYLDPVVAVLIAYPLLGEKVTATYALGAILVFLGIFFSEKRLHWHPLHKLFG